MILILIPSNAREISGRAKERKRQRVRSWDCGLKQGVRWNGGRME
jgi:hypothetical protein